MKIEIHCKQMTCYEIWGKDEVNENKILDRRNPHKNARNKERTKENIKHDDIQKYINNGGNPLTKRLNHT